MHVPTARRNSSNLPAALLAWYDRHARILPWRARPGARPDPYRVWLAEIMLQQTTTATVGPYFRKFLDRWPTVADLAAAAQRDVLAAWAGLGYYARARNLHKCAQVVARNLGGRFPDDEDTLRALPGIGPYTAAAVAAIAFGRRAAAVDGNVERVMSRLYAIAEPLPGAKTAIRRAAAALVPAQRPGDYAQAAMDLGATICTPRKPRCGLCPWAGACAARALGDPERFPYKAPKGDKPARQGAAFVLFDGVAVWLRRRPEKGLLGGMMAPPSTAWQAAPVADAVARRAAPPGTGWCKLPGAVRHGFTHFDLELAVWIGRPGRRKPADGEWWPVERLGEAGLPTLMRKVVAHALAAGYAPTGAPQPPRQSASARARLRISAK
ncbi:MAG: A/G-specific adenine glycosylase [Rhodospirillales bacterium]|nr:A/G-specific adenine glycosylase [Rhodospirillales bacterium]